MRFSAGVLLMYSTARVAAVTMSTNCKSKSRNPSTQTSTSWPWPRECGSGTLPRTYVLKHNEADIPPVKGAKQEVQLRVDAVVECCCSDGENVLNRDGPCATDERDGIRILAACTRIATSATGGCADETSTVNVRMPL
jgi:hypothetical protein